jgi:membrane-associated phospholipid phosphatase
MAGAEILTGALLLSGAALAGLLLVDRPWPNRLDVDGFSLLHPHPNSHLLNHITDLGGLPALIGAIALAVVISIGHDRARALSCSLAPLAAVFVTERVAKPLVGRHLGPQGLFTYPSGTVTAASAIVTVIFLISPALLRPVVAAVGLAAIAATAAAVVSLRWHYPTDAIGGACVGIGAVFFVDGLFHMLPAIRFDKGRSPRALSGAARFSGSASH